MDNITDFTAKRLKKKPVVYSVEFIHDADGFMFGVHDVQDSDRDRLAVADDLERAAKMIRDNLPGKQPNQD